MASGRHEMVINTQERAVSTDINRLQKFTNSDTAEVWRLILSGLSGGEYSPGFVVFPNGGEAPVQGEIIGGLMVRPQSGTFGISIDPGIAMFEKPDGAADDNDFKFIRDPGLSLGTLSFGANASGSIRIDVVECSINPTPASVTDSRDIFNTSTGLFNATTVTKEQKAQFQYRIRQGTPGSGYPTAQGGWLPLMIASIPNGAASNDNITFWDVRPLAEDRDRFGRQGVFLKAGLREFDGEFVRVNAGSALLNGKFSASVKGRVLGGTIFKCTPGADTNGIDVANAAEQSGTYTEPLAASVYLYACTPFGLSRWGMYAPAPASRIPRSLGMLIASTVEPDEFGMNTNTIALPTSTGLGGSVQLGEAVCVAVFSKASQWKSFYANAKRIAIAPSTSAYPVVSAGAPTGGGAANSDFTVDTSFFPPHAKAIWCRIAGRFTVPATALSLFQVWLDVFDSGTPGSGVDRQTPLPELNLANPDAAPHDQFFSYIVRIPLPTKFPNATTTPRVVRLETVETAYAGGGVTGTHTFTLQLLDIEQ